MSSSCYRVLNEATRAALFLLSAKLELGPLDSAEMVLTSSRTLYSWPVIKAQVGKAVGRVLRGREAFGPCWVGLVGYGKGEGCVWSLNLLPGALSPGLRWAWQAGQAAGMPTARFHHMFVEWSGRWWWSPMCGVRCQPSGPHRQHGGQLSRHWFTPSTHI